MLAEDAKTVLDGVTVNGIADIYFSLCYRSIS